MMQAQEEEQEESLPKKEEKNSSLRSLTFSRKRGVPVRRKLEDSSSQAAKKEP